MDVSVLNNLCAFVLLQGVTMPEDGQDAWVWVAGTMALMLVGVGGTLATVFWRVVEDKDKQIAQLRDDGKTCASELGKTSDSLQKMTDVSERQRQTITEGFASQGQIITSGLERVDRKMTDILDIIAPRQHGGRP